MRVVTLTREELHRRVWAAPLRTVAAEIGISDVGLSKACKRHDIPTPKQGYWLRRSDRKKVPPLPPKHEDDSQITFYINDSGFKPKPQKLLKLEVDVIDIPSNLRGAHPLVLATQESTRGVKFDEVKGKQEFRTHRHLDVRVSPQQFDLTLRIASALILASEAKGAKWTIDAKGATWLTFDRQRMQVYFVEKMNQIPWPKPPAPSVKKGEEWRPNLEALLLPKWKRVGTGLVSFIVDAHLPNGIQRKWGAGKHQLETQLAAIVAHLPVLAIAIKAMNDEYEARQIASERRRQIRIQAARDAETTKILRDRLVQTAHAHQSAAAIRNYCLDVAKRYDGLELAEEDRAKLDDWLFWAREQADHIDPANQPLASLLDRTVALAPDFDSTVRHPFGRDD